MHFSACFRNPVIFLHLRFVPYLHCERLRDSQRNTPCTEGGPCHSHQPFRHVPAFASSSKLRTSVRSFATMLFSESMCFFKKFKPVPRAMDISAPIPSRSDLAFTTTSTTSLLPPYQHAYPIHTTGVAPIPPPKVYHTKHPLSVSPRRPSVTTESNSSSGSRSSSTDTVARVYLPATPKSFLGSPAPVPRSSVAAPAARGRTPAPIDYSRKPSVWARTTAQTARRRPRFQNAGLDEHGRLKLGYVEVGGDGTEWGVPEEWSTSAERQVASRRAGWGGGGY